MRPRHIFTFVLAGLLLWMGAEAREGPVARFMEEQGYANGSQILANVSLADAFFSGPGLGPGTLFADGGSSLFGGGVSMGSGMGGPSGLLFSDAGLETGGSLGFPSLFGGPGGVGAGGSGLTFAVDSVAGVSDLASMFSLFGL